MILGEGERSMRKRILILSLSLLAICFVGCGREKGDENSLTRQETSGDTESKHISDNVGKDISEVISEAGSDSGEAKEYAFEDETIDGVAKAHIVSYQEGAVKYTIENLTSDSEMADIYICVCAVDKNGKEFHHVEQSIDVSHIPAGQVSEIYETYWKGAPKTQYLDLEDAKTVRIYFESVNFFDGTHTVEREEQEKNHPELKN